MSEGQFTEGKCPGSRCPVLSDITTDGLGVRCSAGAIALAPAVGGWTGKATQSARLARLRRCWRGRCFDHYWRKGGHGCLSCLRL